MEGGRTDNQILSREPIALRFGDGNDIREYPVKPKPRSESRKFREGVGNVLDGLDDLAAVVGGMVDTKGTQNISLDRVMTTIKGLFSTKLDQALAWFLIMHRNLKGTEGGLTIMVTTINSLLR